MDQAATLTTGWEPDTPLGDSILRQFVFAYANRVAWMARATGGRVDRNPAACIADVGSAFGYDNAAVLLQPPAATDLLGGLGRAHRLFPAERWWIPAQRLAAARVPTRWDVAGRAPAADAAPTRPVQRRPTIRDADLPRPRPATPRRLRHRVEGRLPLPGGAADADHRLLGAHLRLLAGYDGDQPVATAGGLHDQRRRRDRLGRGPAHPPPPRHRRGHDRGRRLDRPGPASGPPRQRRRAQPLPPCRLHRPAAPHDLGIPPTNRHER